MVRALSFREQIDLLYIQKITCYQFPWDSGKEEMSRHSAMKSVT